MAATNEEVRKALTSSHALRVLNLDDIQVDPSYQRDVKKKHALIIANFNEEALGIPVVAEREELTLWIVDGLQRITAVRKMGRKTLRCEVFKSRGPEHEAEVFKLINMGRTRLKPQEEFRALLTAHDPLAWQIKEAVERCGFKLVLNSTCGGKHTSNPHIAAREIQCISALMDIARRKWLPMLEMVLPILPDCWPDDGQATRREIIYGLISWCNRHDGTFDRERLVHNLRSVTPHKLVYAASQANLGNNDKTASMADQIEKVYRRRVIKNKQ